MSCRNLLFYPKTELGFVLFVPAGEGGTWQGKLSATSRAPLQVPHGRSRMRSQLGPGAGREHRGSRSSTGLPLPCHPGPQLLPNPAAAGGTPASCRLCPHREATPECPLQPWPPGPALPGFPGPRCSTSRYPWRHDITSAKLPCAQDSALSSLAAASRTFLTSGLNYCSSLSPGREPSRLRKLPLVQTAADLRAQTPGGCDPSACSSCFLSPLPEERGIPARLRSRPCPGSPAGLWEPSRSLWRAFPWGCGSLLPVWVRQEEGKAAGQGRGSRGHRDGDVPVAEGRERGWKDQGRA